MNTNFSFKTQITWLSTGLILLTVIILTDSNRVRFADYAEEKIEEKLYVAHNVLDQSLSLQEQVLITTANVLTADFGFKQAVASKDKDTIKSVLINHGKRINADLILLLDLEGRLLTGNSQHSFTIDTIEKNIGRIPFRDVHAQILSIDAKVFQIIIVPVKAPRIIAYTVIGFEFDRNSLLQFKDLLSLDVSLIQTATSDGKQQNTSIVKSSLDDTKIQQEIISGTIQKHPNLLLTRSEYFHRTIPFGKSNDVQAILSVSLIQIQNDFNQLILYILMIAFIVIIIAITLSRILARRLSKPLKLLMKITQNIGRGNLEVPALNNHLPAEFTELYQGFVLMGSEIEQREVEITYQAERDLLTGLYNRYKVLNEIQNIIHNNINLALITVNIKGFKTLNDTIGISNSDAILKETADRIVNYLDKKNPQAIDTSSSSLGIAARINADEFLVCLPVPNTQSINSVLNGLRTCLEQPFCVEGIKMSVCLYYGIANSMDHGTDAEKLIRRSSMAALSARQDQLKLKYYQKGDDEAYLSKLHLIEELRAALDNTNSPLFMNYQPKLNLKTGKVDKFEALIRWINKKNEFVNPEVFVGLAEQAGLIITLTRWVILNVIQQIDTWNELGYHFKVSINLSAQDIQHEDFTDYLLMTLKKHNVEPNQITLELTERDLADNENLVAERLKYLKTLGFEVSVDDYGIGQSSLAKLKNLPVDELKIDKTFILTLDQCQEDQDIVLSTISLGHKLGLRVVAEGVENKASLALLRQFECDYIQGYYLSRPLEAEKIIEWYQSDEQPN